MPIYDKMTASAATPVQRTRLRCWLAGGRYSLWLCLASPAWRTYAPLLMVERVYVVVPLRYPDSPVVSMRRTDELREVRMEPAGYGWAWSVPHENGWFGTELEYQINWRRLVIQTGLWVTMIALLMASIRSSKSASEISQTREHQSEEGDSAAGGV